MKKSVKKILCSLLVALFCITSIPLSDFTTAKAANETTYITKNDLESGYIYFGSYPQSKVRDTTTISALNSLAPEWDSWTSYGYYSGTGDFGTMVSGDWMRYTDVTYNDERYRGVKFTQYRPYKTFGSSSGTHQDNNGYITDKVYWFKFESLKWRVLDADTGLIMCETIIDSQPYSNTIYYNKSVSKSKYRYFNDASYTHYVSDYETSSIRAWLNDDFYNTAFTSTDQSTIATTTLNNDGYYTLTGTTGYEKLDSNDTKDKIFLLSYDEACNSSYLSSSTVRQAQGSDYAECQGLRVLTNVNYKERSFWLLRSPGGWGDNCCGVDDVGFVHGILNGYVYYSCDGVRPALKKLNLKFPHTHSYVSSVTKQPTHTEEGETTFTCACGDTYTESIDKLADHVYVAEVIVKATCTQYGNVTYTCVCGDSYTESIPATGHTFSGSKCTTCGYDRSDSCSCNCHKSGIVKFFFNIINFFQKLFGNNKTCDCGASH